MTLQFGLLVICDKIEFARTRVNKIRVFDRVVTLPPMPEKSVPPTPVLQDTVAGGT